MPLQSSKNKMFKVTRIPPPCKRESANSQEGGKNSVSISVDIEQSGTDTDKRQSQCFPKVVARPCAVSDGKETKSASTKQSAINIINGYDEAAQPSVESRRGRVPRAAKQVGERKTNRPLKNNLTLLTPSNLSQPASSNLISNLVLPSPSNLPIQKHTPVINEGGAAISPNYSLVSPKKQKHDTAAPIGDLVSQKKNNYDHTLDVSLPAERQLAHVPKDYYKLSPQSDEWMDDSLHIPWKVSPEEESLASNLKGVQDLFSPSSINELHRNADEYNEQLQKGLTNEMVEAIQGLGNLLPEDFLDLYKLKSDRDKWDHIRYLANNMSQRQKKWRRYSMGGPKRDSGNNDRGVMKKVKMDSKPDESFTSYDMPSLLEEKVINEMGIPLRASSPILKYDQTNASSSFASTPTQSQIEHEPMKGIEFEQSLVSAPAQPQIEHEPMKGIESVESAPPLSSRPLIRPAILPPPEFQQSRDLGQIEQEEPMRSIEFERSSDLPQIEHESMKGIEFEQPLNERDSAPKGVLGREIMPVETSKPLPTPPSVESAPPLSSRPLLRPAILPPPEARAQPALQLSHKAALPPPPPPPSSPRTVLKKRQLRSLDDLARGKKPKTAQNDRSHYNAIEDLEELLGVADVMSLPSSYNYDDYDVDFLTSRKKLQKRKLPRTPIKDPINLNPKSTRYIINEPKPKKRRYNKRKRK